MVDDSWVPVWSAAGTVGTLACLPMAQLAVRSFAEGAQPSPPESPPAQKEARRLAACAGAATIGCLLVPLSWTGVLAQHGAARGRGLLSATTLTALTIVLLLQVGLLWIWRARPHGEIPTRTNHVLPALWVFRIVAALGGAAMFVVALTVDMRGWGFLLVSGAVLATFALGVTVRPIETWLRHRIDRSPAGQGAQLYGAISAWLYLWPAGYAALVALSLFVFGTLGVGGIHLTPVWEILLLFGADAAYAYLEVNLPLDLITRLHEWRIAVFRPWRRHGISYLPTKPVTMPRTAWERRHGRAA